MSADDGDLTEEAPPAPLDTPGQGPARELPPPDRRFISVKKSRPLDHLRHSLARMLIVVLALIALSLIAAATFGPSESKEAVQAIATLVFPSLVTLAGTSFAWFYAQERKKKDDEADQP